MASNLLRSTPRRRSSSSCCTLCSWLVGSSPTDDGIGVGEGSGASPRLALSLSNSTSLIELLGAVSFLVLEGVGRRPVDASLQTHANSSISTSSTNRSFTRMFGEMLLYFTPLQTRIHSRNII